MRVMWWLVCAVLWSWAMIMTVAWWRVRRHAHLRGEPLLFAVEAQLRGVPALGEREDVALPACVVPFHVDEKGRVRATTTSVTPHAERVKLVARFLQSCDELPADTYYVNVEDVDVYVPGVPVLSFNVHRDRWRRGGLLLPDPYLMAFGSEFELVDQTTTKPETRAVFRGYSTGLPFHRGQTKREVLARYAAAYPDTLDVKVSCSSQTVDCDALADITAPPMSVGRQLQHRFVICVDGNAAAWNRIVWQLRSDCLVFHESSYYHFATLGLVPYQHYVPYELRVDEDGSVVCNLAEQVARYAKEPEQATHIAAQATLYAEQYITLAHARQYTTRLLQGLHRTLA